MLWSKSRDGVRTARRRDADAINDLRRQAHEMNTVGRPDIFQKPFGDALAQQTSRMLREKDNLLLVYEKDGAVCGFLYATFESEGASDYWDSRTFCRVQEIIVDKPLRGQGIGTALMDEVRREAVSRGCPKLELQVWAFNGGACAFWTKQGFTPYMYCMEWKTETGNQVNNNAESDGGHPGV